MCTRYVVATPLHRLAEEFGFDPADLRPPPEPSWNVAPSEQALAIRAGEDTTQPFLPVWGIEASGRNVVNARVETAFERSAFRDAMARRRCLVPADGFYEWRSEGGGKQPYLLSAANRRPLAMAAIYTHDNPHGPPRFVVLTTDARGPAREVHERMPLLISPERYAAWLDPANDTPDKLAPALADTVELVRRPVSRKVNDPRNDGPDLLDPPLQTSLF